MDIDDDDIFTGGGYFFDDGTPIDPSMIPIPDLCKSCYKYRARGKEEVLCTLTRADQKDEEHFQCGAYYIAVNSN